MAINTYSIGRSNTADIQLSDPGISRIHAELTVTEDGRYYLVDANSTAGTFIRRLDDWIDLTQGFVTISDTLSLGKSRIAVSEIIQKANALRPASSSPEWDPLTWKPQRLSLTGEVI